VRSAEPWVKLIAVIDQRPESLFYFDRPRLSTWARPAWASTASLTQRCLTSRASFVI